MNYKVIIKKVLTAGGEIYTAQAPALQGVMGGGATPEEALKVLEIEAEELIQFMKDEGEDIPASDLINEYEQFSGRVTYRLGKKTHHDLSVYAEENGISLNTAINEAVLKLLGESDGNNKLNQVFAEVKNLTNVIEKQREDIRNSSKYTNTGNRISQWSDLGTTSGSKIIIKRS